MYARRSPLPALALTVICLSALVWPAAAEPDYTLVPEAQIRPRWEADSGRDANPDDGRVSYFTMRTRLGATLATDKLALRVVFSDVRSFGEAANTRRDFDADGIDVRIATLTWTMSRGAALQVGRIEESLLNERLLAIAYWRQPGRSFDGARATLERETWSLDARALLLREGDVSDFANTDQVVPGGDDALWFSLAGTLEAGPLTLSPALIYDTDDELSRDRATVGMLADISAGTLSYHLEAWGQLGATQSSSADDEDSILAGMFGASTTWAPKVATKPKVTLQYEVLSADGSPNDGRNTAFDTLFGANHRFYGNIDIAVFQAGGFRNGQGLQDPALKVRITPTRGVTLGLDNHAFLSARPSDLAFLAYEPDASIKIKLAKNLTLSGGANLWLPPESSEREWMTWTMLDGKL